MIPIHQAYQWIQPGAVLPPVYEPEDVESCRRWIGRKNGERAALLIAGGCSHWFLGNTPPRVTDVLSVRRWNRVIEHSPGDLTVTVEAGCPMVELNEVLKASGQFLPFFPVGAQNATIGGIVSTGLSGPYGPSLGSPRDYLIGIEVLHSDGIVSHAGGKVVKNVAGYDLCKLYTGSMGALGIITKLTFKLRPRPQHSATLLLPFESFPELVEAALKIRDKTDPAALEVIQPGTAFLSRHLAPSRFILAVQALDSPEVVQWKVSTIRRQFPLSQLLDEKAEQELWTLWNEDFRRALEPENGVAVLRISSPLGQLATVYRALSHAIPFHAMTGHFRNGHLFLFAKGSEFSEGWLTFTKEWISQHVYTTLFKADAQVRKGADVWGLTSQPVSIMEQIKKALDPNGILNPGRFL